MALSKEDAQVIKSAVDIIKRELAAEVPNTLNVYKIGTFKGKTAPARKARYPKTGATLDVPARTVVRFSASKAWTEGL